MFARVLLLIFLLCIPLAAQEGIHEYLEVDLVDLYLTATDSKGRFIINLRPEDLVVLEDGVPQKIERFGTFAGERGEIPILLAIVIDNSGSMDMDLGGIPRLDLSRNAALSLLKQLGPLDRVMLGRFSDQPVISPLTSKLDDVEKTLHEMRPVWGQTAVVDSLATIINELQKNFGRKILLLCTDGQDNLSRTRFQDVMKTAADTTDLTVVVLGAGATNAVVSGMGKVDKIPDVPYLRSREYLQRLADSTAGFAYFPQKEKDVSEVLDRIGSFIQSQYYLAYKSNNPQSGDSSRRKVEIKSKRKGVTLHYRHSYSAS